MIVVILGSRERAITPIDKRTVEELLAKLMFEHGSRLLVLSYGCDIGIGRMVADTSQRLNIKFSECRVKFYQDGFTPEEINKLYAVRNSAWLSIGDEFHLFTGPNPDGLVEQLIVPAIGKVKSERVKVYHERR